MGGILLGFLLLPFGDTDTTHVCSVLREDLCLLCILKEAIIKGPILLDTWLLSLDWLYLL